MARESAPRWLDNCPVSGVDTVRGINYQHCHALLAALEVVLDPNVVGIRVEGTDDVLDLEIHAIAPDSGVEPFVVRGLQMKSRLQPYTWAKGELLDIVRRWASRPVSSRSEFVLLTDGELGPSGRQVQEALRIAADGDLDPIAEFLGLATHDPLVAVAARASIVSEPGTVEAMLHAAEREVRARLPFGPNHPDAPRLAEERVNALFRVISTHSGMPDPDDRMISRDALTAVLGGLSQVTAANRWAGDLGEEYRRLAAAEDVSGVALPVLKAEWRKDPLTLGELAGISGPILLTGRTGSGKSTVARLWRVSAAGDRERVVVCHAEAYMPRQLGRAVADAVGEVVGRDLPSVVGQQVLGDARSTIVIDGVSEVPSEFRRELAMELRNHFAARHGARTVLLGRDESVCASVLPATQASNRLHPAAFGHQERMSIVANFLGKPRSGGTTADGLQGKDVHGASYPGRTSFHHDCERILAQIQHALGEAAGIPMLLQLALELVGGGIPFTDRASLYELTVDRLAARANVADIRIASAALGIVFARLLDEGRRYANPLEWARLVSEATTTLESLGVVTEPNEVREAIERSGLVNAVVTGIGQSRLRVPLHDSFADYLAARAHAEGLVSLPATLVENDENRVLFSAQMSELSDEESLAVAAQLPFTLVRLSESDNREIDDHAPDLVAALLCAVLPDLEPTRVIMWRDHGRIVVRVGAPETRWVPPPEVPDLFAGLTAIAEPTDGPLVMTVRLWRLILKRRLRGAPRPRPRSPRSRSEGRDQLAAHCNAAAVAIERMIGEVAPAVATDRLARVIGPMGMTGVVHKRQAEERAGWVVRYQRTATVDIEPADTDAGPAPEMATDLPHTGDIEFLLSTSPEQTAAKRIIAAINELTAPNWL